MSIVIYTTKACAYCPMVAKWLANKGLSFTKVELDDKPELRQELLEKTGAMTVPITMVEKYEIQHGSNQLVEKFIVGWNPAKLSEVIG